MLDSSLAQSIATAVAPRIVSSTSNIKLPTDSWEVIVKIIVEEVFNQIKTNAVVIIDPVVAGGPQAMLSTAPGGGPVTGNISPSSSPVTGKIA